MAKLIIDGKECRDTWLHPDDTETFPNANFTVSLERWLAEREQILEFVYKTGYAHGVRLRPDSDPAALASDIDRFTLIVIEIDDGGDGRFFSIAARLREHWGFQKELRVIGEVAPDQLLFMRRCGINAFELSDDLDPSQFVARYRRFYQVSGPDPSEENTIGWARRRQSRSSETA